MENFDLLTRQLGKPVYDDGRAILFCGDCLDLLKKFSANSVSLTVTSPPYNIGKEYEKVRPLPEYLQWTKSWMQQIHRVTADGGAFWLNLGYVEFPGRAKAVPLPYFIWNLSDFYLIQEIIWNYGAGVAGRKFFSPRNEKLLWFVKDSDNYTFNLDDVRDPNVKYPNQKKNGKLKCNPLGKNPTDVWQIPKVTSGANRSSVERTNHPAQFPTELVSRIIVAASRQNDVILDPFAGSGSTLEAAVRLGRRAIGIEINDKYIGTAITRLQRAKQGLRITSLRKEGNQLPIGDLFRN